MIHGTDSGALSPCPDPLSCPPSSQILNTQTSATHVSEFGEYEISADGRFVCANGQKPITNYSRRSYGIADTKRSFGTAAIKELTHRTHTLTLTYTRTNGKITDGVLNKKQTHAFA